MRILKVSQDNDSFEKAMSGLLNGFGFNVDEPPASRLPNTLRTVRIGQKVFLDKDAFEKSEEEAKQRDSSLRRLMGVEFGVDPKYYEEPAVVIQTRSGGVKALIRFRDEKQLWTESCCLRPAVTKTNKTAQNLQFVESPKLDERGTMRAIRDAIINEQVAVQQYEAIVDGVSDEQSKKVLQDIANEEKVHVGELQALLKKIDPEEKVSLDEGEKEVDEMSVEASINDKTDGMVQKTASYPVQQTIEGRVDEVGRPIRAIHEYVLFHKRLRKYYAGGSLHSPELSDYKNSMPIPGGSLLDMAWDWTQSWIARVYE